MNEQPSLLLETFCRECGTSLPYSGVGRPRALCSDCRPEWYPPLKEVPSAVSRTVMVRSHERRIGGARASEADTSHHAARTTDRQGSEAVVLAVFEAHPGGLTDDELCALVPDRYGPTLRTARSRLSRTARHPDRPLVDTGVRRDSVHGRPQAVWRLA